MIRTGFLSLAVLLSCATATMAAPFTNGSFEAPVVGGTFSTIPGGGSIGGWTVAGTTGVDHIGTFWYGYLSQQSVDLNATSAGSISQTFDTIANQLYEVTFALSRNSDANSFGVLQAGVLVQDNAMNTLYSQLFATPAIGLVPGSNNSSLWLNYSFQFVATSSSTTLSFAGVPGAGAYGPVVDAVTVAAVVPEPASLAVWGLMTAVGSVVAYRRRRNA